MSGDAVFVVVSIAIIFAFTAYRIWVDQKARRLYKKLQQLIDEANRK